MRGLVRLLVCLGVAGAASAWTVDGTRLLDGAQPVGVLALSYPLEARRDGRPLDPAALVAKVKGSGLTALVLTVAEGPTLVDARPLAEAAQAAGLAVLLQPAAEDVAATARLVAALADVPHDAWLADASAPSPPTPLARLWDVPALYQGALGYGAWAAGLAAARAETALPLLARVEAAPPDWLVERGDLRTAAPHPDLYRSARQRPETAAALAGEYLLLPEPAQIRLAAYAALGRGARGLVFDHAGHLLAGEPPCSGAARAAMVTTLAAELGPLLPFLAVAEPVALPPLPRGVAGGLLRHGDEWLLLLWRDRPLDTRAVGGTLLPSFALELPVVGEGLQVHELQPDGLRLAPADWRPGGLRLEVPPLDLTAAWWIGLRPPAEEATARRAALPETAARAVRLAVEHWRQVDYTLSRLERLQRSVGGRAALASAAARLGEAAAAVRHGYLRSGLELAAEAARLTRQAQTVELEAALAGGAEAATFALLPALYEPPDRLPRGPYELGDRPLVLDFDSWPAGSLPERWTALEGLDQTVVTLRVAEGGRESPRALAWQPRGSDPGALSLPFSPRQEVRVSLWLRAAAPPAGERLILLAPGPGLAPLGGLVLRPDGGVAALGTAGAGGRLRPGQWQRLELHQAAGRLSVSLDGQVLDSREAMGPAGALLLAKRAGDDPVVLALDGLEIR